MINSKQIKWTGGLNSDSDVRVLPLTDYLNCENLRASVNEFGTGLNLQNIPSTVLKYSSYPTGTNFPFGSAVDLSSQRLFWMNINSNGNHGIYCYDSSVNVYYIVLLSSQTVAGFNWSKSFRIDRNARTPNGMLVYTDNNNEPQEINIEAGIKLNQSGYVTSVLPYATPIPYTTLTLIKRPPAYPLQVAKTTDDAYPNNYILDGAFQFLHYYQYKNYEISALSAYSPLVPPNFKEDTDNYILVQMPFTEHIDDYVLRTSFVVQNGNDGRKFEFKTWDKTNPNDAAAIAAHNAGTTNLQINFYNDIGGVVLDDVFASNNFDNIPLQTKTIEQAKNRLFLANNKKGYNTPLATSLTATLETFGTDVNRVFKGGSKYRVSIDFKDRYRRKTGAVDTNIYVTIPDRVYTMTVWAYHINWTLSNTAALTEIPADAYYYQILLSKNQTKLFFIEGAFKNASYVSKNANGAYDYSSVVFNDNNTYALAVDLSPLNVDGIGYVYDAANKDQAIIYRRDGTNFKAPVVGQDGSYVFLKPTDIGTLHNSFQWLIGAVQGFGNTADWAFIGMSLITPITNPAGVSAQSGEYVIHDFDGTDWRVQSYDGATRVFDIAGTITFKSNDDADYVRVVASVGEFTQVIIAEQAPVTNGTTYTLPISGTVTTAGGVNKIYIIFIFSSTNTVDVISGNLSIGEQGGVNLIEIYTPYKQAETEPIYEASDVYAVANPTTNTRQYSALSGSLKGDSYLIGRMIDSTTGYIAETMSPNDSVWQTWARDLGWINRVDKIGQTFETDNIDFTDTFISGTKVNGLNKIQALNTKNIGNSTGDIQKLQLANKQQEDGTVMLILTEEETLSAYLGEIQLEAATQNFSSPIQTAEVIGTINALKNNRGTIHPESVIEYNGDIWWTDALHNKFCQYGDNGVIDISDYDFKRFTTRYFSRYIQQGKAAIETLCGFSYIQSCVDASTNRVIFVLPQVELGSFQPNLPSYDDTTPDYASSIKNRFDIYCSASKPITIAYNFQENKWKEVYEWIPEWADYLGNNFFGFKDGALHLFNADNTVFDTVFGVQYPQRICFVINDLPSSLKDLMDIVVEANGSIPNYSVAYVKYPNEQITDLASTDVDESGNPRWQDKEGMKYSTWLLDRLSPNIPGTASDKMYSGDILKSAVIFIMLEFQVYDKQLIINFTDVGWQISAGHLQIQNQKQTMQ